MPTPLPHQSHPDFNKKNKLASFDPRRLNATTRIEPTRRSHRGLRSRQRWTSSGTAAPLRTSSGAPSAPTPRRSTTLDLTNQRRQSHHGPDRVRDRRGSRRGGAETAAWLLPPVARGVADSPAACGGVASNGYDKRRYFYELWDEQADSIFCLTPLVRCEAGCLVGLARLRPLWYKWKLFRSIFYTETENPGMMIKKWSPELRIYQVNIGQESVTQIKRMHFVHLECVWWRVK